MTTRANRRRTSRSRSGRRIRTHPPLIPTGTRKPRLHPVSFASIRARSALGADGSFPTPPQLMTGSSYRITIRPEGDPLSLPTGPRRPPSCRPFRRFDFKQRPKLVGLIHDRRDEPVAGARVFLPSGEPSTTTGCPGPLRARRNPPRPDLPAGPGPGLPPSGLAGRPGQATRGAGSSSWYGTSEPPDRTDDAPAGPDPDGRVASPGPAGCSSRICKPPWPERAMTIPGGIASAS